MTQSNAKSMLSIKYREGLDPTLLVGIRDVDPKDMENKEEDAICSGQAVRSAPLPQGSNPMGVVI
jgi:hypothetical protein